MFSNDDDHFDDDHDDDHDDHDDDDINFKMFCCKCTVRRNLDR